MQIHLRVYFDQLFILILTNLLFVIFFKVLKVSVDKRITIGQLKTEMQKWIGVSQEHFKLYKIFSNR